MFDKIKKFLGYKSKYFVYCHPIRFTDGEVMELPPIKILTVPLEKGDILRIESSTYGVVDIGKNVIEVEYLLEYGEYSRNTYFVENGEAFKTF